MREGGELRWIVREREVRREERGRRENRVLGLLRLTRWSVREREEREKVACRIGFAVTCREKVACSG